MNARFDRVGTPRIAGDLVVDGSLRNQYARPDCYKLPRFPLDYCNGLVVNADLFVTI